MIFSTPDYDVRKIIANYQNYDYRDYFFDYYYRFWFPSIHFILHKTHYEHSVKKEVNK